MPVIPGVTVDYGLSPRLITIPATSDPFTVTIEDLQDTLQDIEDEEDDGIVYPRLRDCSGGESLGGGAFVSWTMQLSNAQIRFSASTVPLSEASATANDAAGKILTDASATFVTDGVERGDTVFNWTTRATAMVTEVISQTQLRHVQLFGGSRVSWLIGDDYRVNKVTRCILTAGNLTAVDALGAPLDPLLESPFTLVERVSATSGALVAAGSITAEVAAAVWDESAVAHVAPGSTGRLLTDAYTTSVDTYNLLADVADLVDDLHDEALGKWTLNPATSTLTLFRTDGSVLRVFQLKAAVGDVPPYVERAPV